MSPIEAQKKLEMIRLGRSSGIVEDTSLEKEDLSKLFKPDEEGADPNSEDYRNQVQSRLLAKSDINCNQFVEAVDSRRAASNVTLGIFATATATAAAIVSGRAGQNLAGMSAVTSAAEQSINDEMFSGILMPNIVREIRTSRSVLRDAISKKYGQKTKDYSYYAAVADAIYYHNLCSLTVALSSIVSKASTAEAKRTLSSDEMLAALDGEILATRNAILSNDLGLTPEQKNQLRDDLMKQYRRRAELVKTFALPGWSDGAATDSKDENKNKAPQKPEDAKAQPAPDKPAVENEKASVNGTAVTGKTGPSGGTAPEKSKPRPSGSAAAGAELLLQ
jgi:F0F1-type ATP synthase membrane subunit c/vacuolar-type H+-ATPase subunit K